MYITVNGQLAGLPADGEMSLLTFLREELGLTGAKHGCGHGGCGACLVLVDGEPTLACVTPARSIAGQTVTTVEGLASGETLHPVQQAFVREDAMQCGACTSGMILASVALLNREPDPREADIVSALDGHLCRCGVHARVVRAVKAASALLRTSVEPSP